MKTKPNHMISTDLERLEKGLQLLYRGKIVQKRKVHTLKGKLTLTDYKRLLIDYKKSDIGYKAY